MKLHSILTMLVLATMAASAKPAPVAGSSSGQWVSPNPSGGSIVTTGVGTPDFTWGDASAFELGNNSLSFSGASFASVTETPFMVGSIQYHNGTTALGSTPDFISLALDLNFGAPSIGHVISTYVFGLNSTPNSDDPDASADFVSLPSGFSTTSFAIGSVIYNVKLTGFQNIHGDGFLASSASEFHVREGGIATADVYAVVTTQMIPEPQTYALMLAGLGAMGMVVRRRTRRG